MDYRPTATPIAERRYVWTAGNCHGFLPRVNHVLVTDGETLYSLGGNDNDWLPQEWRQGQGLTQVYSDGASFYCQEDGFLGQIQDDEKLTVYTLEKEASTWRMPHTSCPTLPGRHGHSCCYYNGKVYLYGGKNGSTFFGEVECYDIKNNSWMTLDCLVEDCAYPSARFGHACAVNGPIMYIQGGRVEQGSYRGDLYTAELLSFNMETGVWRVETPNYKIPPTGGYGGLPLQRDFLLLHRDFHSAVYVDGKIIVFGGRSPEIPRGCVITGACEYDIGFYEYNTISRKWKKHFMTGYRPPGRRTVTAVCFGSSIIYCGGYANRKFFDDLFSLDTKTNHITMIKPFGEGPPPLRGASACLLHSQIVLCGGVQQIQVHDIPGKKASDSSIQYFDRNFETLSQVYALHLLPSLEHFCLMVVAKEKLSIALLPPKLQRKVSLFV